MSYTSKKPVSEPVFGVCHDGGVLRWWVAGLIFLATLINFVNRLTVAVLGPVITQQLGLSASEFASFPFKSSNA